jgi:hypothetical protein
MYELHMIHVLVTLILLVVFTNAHFPSFMLIFFHTNSGLVTQTHQHSKEFVDKKDFIDDFETKLLQIATCNSTTVIAEIKEICGVDYIV